MNEDTLKRFYELGYLITPTTPEVEVGSEVDTLKKQIETAAGSVHSEGVPEFIDLAYTMEKTVASKKLKWSQAYFGWIKFEAAPESLAVLKKSLDGTQSLVRYILIKTSVDNTVVFKKPKGDARRETVLSDEEMQALITATEAEASESSKDEKDEHEKLPALDIETPVEQAPEVKAEE